MTKTDAQVTISQKEYNRLKVFERDVLERRNQMQDMCTSALCASHKTCATCPRVTRVTKKEAKA